MIRMNIKTALFACAMTVFGASFVSAAAAITDPEVQQGQRQNSEHALLLKNVALGALCGCVGGAAFGAFIGMIYARLRPCCGIEVDNRPDAPFCRCVVQDNVDA